MEPMKLLARIKRHATRGCSMGREAGYELCAASGVADE
jgi:hypothetical protein